MGSVVAHELGPNNNLPPLCLASPLFPMSLPTLDIFRQRLALLRSDLNLLAAIFKVRDLNMPGGVDDSRFNRRRSLLETVDHHFRTIEESDALDSMDAFYQHAYKLISSPRSSRGVQSES